MHHIGSLTSGRTMRRVLLCGAMLLVHAGTAWSASFDCAKAASGVEQAICADASLSELDTQLGDLYTDTLNTLPANQLQALRADQRNWLAVRNACRAQPARENACLRDSIKQRLQTLTALDRRAAAALDQAIAEIPAHPAEAAAKLRAYQNGLASAWLVYLHQFEPASGVGAAEAQARERVAVAALTDDPFGQSVLQDVMKDPKESPDKRVLTLLRMQIERAGYDVWGDRPYVHCFVFARQGQAAYDTMAGFYGSSRDGAAPVCAPTGKLFELPAWQSLSAAFYPLMDFVENAAGTLRFGAYADWAALELRATLSPRDFLQPALRKAAPDPDSSLRDWPDEKAWPRARREAALNALPATIAATARWLHDDRGLSDADARAAARTIVFTWVDDRLALANQALGDD